ncbi:MAG: DUF2155 domain-containing protein [Pseudomonadota bacterium]
MIGRAFALLLGLSAPLYAQNAVETGNGVGAVVRAIDTLNGRVEDLSLSAGETRAFGRIEITLTECRYPAANPSDDAFAYLEIRDPRETAPRFSGWMLASSPALSALEHARYDVWVISCITE